MRLVLRLFVLATVLSIPAIGVADAKSHRKTAGRLLELMDMKGVIDQSIDQMLAIQTQQNPGMVAYHDILKSFFEKHMGWKTLKGEFIKVYTEAFSEKELKELIAFYKTPTGKKAIKQMPILMQKGAAIGSKRVQDNMPELQRTIEERQKKLSK